MEYLLTADGLIALFTLTLMEIVLGIDNIVFISIVVGKLPEHQQARARVIGLLLALGFRIILLMTIKWMIGLTVPILTLPFDSFVDPAVSLKDLILIAGGLFLIGKSVTEMHHKLEAVDEDEQKIKVNGFINVILQIVVIDIVFSFDSILTAVGLAKEISVMVAAVVISMIVMIIFSGKISDFINRRPTIKMLALSFLILIGFMLVTEGLLDEEQHIDKGYIYFAMAFSLVVELLNSRLRGKAEPVQLHNIVDNPEQEDK